MEEVWSRDRSLCRSVNYLRVDERTSYLCSTSHAQSLISSRRCKGVLPPVGGLARRHEVISRVNHRERFKSPSEQKACILGYDLPIKIKRSPQFATKPLSEDILECHNSSTKPWLRSVGSVKASGSKLTVALVLSSEETARLETSDSWTWSNALVGSN